MRPKQRSNAAPTLGERRTVSRDHNARVKRRDRFEGLLRLVQRAGRLRHDQAEAALPQGVPRDQDALLRVPEHQCAGGMTRCRDHPPIQLSPAVGLPWFQYAVHRKTLGLLPGIVDPQGPLIPCAHQRRLCGGDQCGASIGPLHCGVAAHVIAVAMGIDQLIDPIALQTVAQQRERTRGARDVAGVDQHVAVPRAQHDLIGIEPVAYDHMDLRREGGRGDRIGRTIVRGGQGGRLPG